MTHLKAFFILLGILVFATGCATAPEVGDSRVPGELTAGTTSPVPEPPSDDPIAYLPAPRQAPPTVTLPSPNPFRFDATKKAALQKEKRRLGVRRVPVDALSPVAARDRLAPPLSGDNLPNPTPPPASPQVEPILPAAEVKPPTIDGATPIEWRIEGHSRAGERPGLRSVALGSDDPTDRAPGASGQRAPEPTVARREPGASVRRDDTAGQENDRREEATSDNSRQGESERQNDTAPGSGSIEGEREESTVAGRRAPESTTAGRRAPEATVARQETSRQEDNRRQEARSDQAAGETEATASVAEEDSPSASRARGERSGYPYEFVDTASETTAPVGEEMGVSLPGEGWLFLGEATHHEAVRFLSQTESDRESRFRFRITEPGTYELLFQRQDLLAGTLAEHTLSVDAESGENGDPDAADEAFTRISAAEIGLSVTGAPTTAGNDAAGRNPSPEGNAGSSATGDSDGVPEESTEVMAEPPWPQGFGTTELLSDIEATLARAEESPEESVLSLSQLLVQRRNPEGALLLLEEYQRRGETEVGLDEVWFEMAQLLERREEVRDLRRAVGLYGRLVDEYPLSVYYREARQRAEYLQRHFFLVR